MGISLCVWKEKVMRIINKSNDIFRSYPVLTVLLLTVLVGAGCAGKSEPGPEVGPPVRAESSGVAESAPQPTTPPQVEPPAEPQQQAKPRTAKTSPPAARPPAAQRMLSHAGRDPGQPQPESGFTLQVPDRVWTGQPFPVAFGASGLQKLAVYWRGKTLTLTPEKDGEACRALLAVPLTEKAASIPLTMNAYWADGKVEEYKTNLAVAKKAYPVQRLKVAQKYVTPPPAVLEKIKRDRAEIRAAISKVTPVRYWSLPMLRPVPGVVTSLYGLRRVFNGEERNPHKGVDFDGKEGDPIAALDRGVVVLVADHYYSGNIVVVDHGLGVYSLYLHLSAFNVKVGQRIERGDTVGFIGSTGRVTGPHLHLSFAVLGEMVNGAACIDM